MNDCWRDEVQEHPEALERARFPHLAEWGKRLALKVQPWPTFVRAEILARWEQQAVRLDRLIKSLPKRLFDDDPARLASFYRLESATLAALLVGEPNGMAEALSRLDLIECDSGLKCIEINSGSYLGGWALSSLAAAYWDEGLVKPFLDRHRPRWSSTQHAMFRHILLRLLEAPPCPDPRSLDVGILFSPGTQEEQIHHATEELLAAAARDAAEEIGVEVPYRVHGVRLDELELRDGCPEAGGVRLHAIVEQQNDLTSKELFRAFKAGRVHLYTGPATVFLSDKRNVALLYELRDSGLFDDDERELIEQFIPWSHVVAPAEVEYRGERVYLPDLLLAERERLVLKPGLASSGTDVHLGRVTPAERWREVVAQAVASRRWVVQELLVPPHDLYQSGERGCEPLEMVWGLFVLGGRPGGGYLRMNRAGGGPLNAATGADIGMYFIVDGEPAAGAAEVAA